MRNTKKKTPKKKTLNLELADVDISKINAQLLPEKDSPSLKERNAYRSAGVFMKSIADEAWSWRESLQEGYQPSIIALLEGGVQIDVLTFSQVSFHGIRIEGTIAGSPCVMFTHQANIQILCHAIKIKKDIPSRTIGFIWPDKEIKI